MNMQLNKQKLIKERKKRAWTQSHLAEVCDVSLRTIQRSEKSGLASPETAKALASVYNLDIEDISVKVEPVNLEKNNELNETQQNANSLEKTIEEIVDQKLKGTNSKDKPKINHFKIIMICILIIIILGYFAEKYNNYVHREMALKECGSKNNIAHYDSKNYSCKTDK